MSAGLVTSAITRLDHSRGSWKWTAISCFIEAQSSVIGSCSIYVFVFLCLCFYAFVLCILCSIGNIVTIISYHGRPA